MKKRRKFVAGNWKMNPQSLGEAKNIFKRIKKSAAKLRNTDIAICVPHLYIGELSKLASDKVQIGTQNIFWEASGSFTGEISAEMARSAGARYTIIGHSERRALGETDENVSKKITAALNEGLTPIVCFGEKVRDNNGEFLEVISTQLKNSISSVSKKEAKKIILAYEPIWAIGRKDNKAMNGRELYEMLLYIRKVLTELYGKEIGFDMRVLYGGSVTFQNTEDIMKEGQVDGLLPGRQSLETEGFEQVLKIVDSV